MKRSRSESSDEEQTSPTRQGAQPGAYGQSSNVGQQPWVQLESAQQLDSSDDDYLQEIAPVTPPPPPRRRPPPLPPALPSQPPVSQMLEGLDQNDYIVLTNRTPNSYTFISCLGKGSYSCVYRGIERRTQMPVAIKVSKAGTGFSILGTLQYEYEILRVLKQKRHKNILEYIDLFIESGRAYFISELAIGDLHSILQVVNSSGVKVWKPLRELECRHIIRGIAEGLNHLHSMSIAHGDIKLANIVMFWKVLPNQRDRPYIQRYDRMTPKLCDFGSSTFRDFDSDPEGKIMEQAPTCTITYAAPESYFLAENRQFDMIAADCYSLGNCLLNMLLGAQPFAPPLDFPQRNDPDKASKMDKYRRYMIKMKRDIKFVESLCTGLPLQLATVLLRLMDPIPENRMTVTEFLADQWLNSQKSSEAEDTIKAKQLGLSLYRSKEWN